MSECDESCGQKERVEQSAGNGGGGWGRSLSISSVARMASVVDVIEKVKF